jgi:hypothetical protein
VGSVRRWPRNDAGRASRFGAGTGASGVLGAAQAWRCYDFRGHGLGEKFFPSADFPVLWWTGRAGARHRRRVLLRLAVDGVPPDWRPSGAGLARGPRRPAGLFTLSRVTPHRGGVASAIRWTPAALSGPSPSVWRTYGVTGPGLARAPMKPTSSRALATTPWVACFPRARRVRSRFQRRTCACPLRSWRAWGGVASRRGQWRRTVAGSRAAQAPSPRARGACIVPAWAMAPCRRRSPLAYAEGSSPQHFRRGLGVSKRGRAPSAATVVTAPGHGTPRRAWRASTTGCTRQEVPGSWRSCASRWRRAVCAVTARPSSWKTIGWAGVGQTTARRHRRWAGPDGAWPVWRRSWRGRKAWRRHVAAWRAGRAASRARVRARMAASSTGGASTGVRAPERLRRASCPASRRSVCPQAPAVLGLDEGATTPQAAPFVARARERQEPPGPAS